MFLLPVIPFVTDASEMIGETLLKAKEVGLDFVIFGGMALKRGRQREYFLDFLGKEHPELLARYAQTYGDNIWGQATEEYYNRINAVFNEISKKHKIPRRIPPTLYRDILSENDLVVVMLEHLDYFLRLDGKRSSFGHAAHEISKLNKTLSTMKGSLREIKGVGEKTEEIILEILEKKDSAYYNSLR